jgi:hypothetical protein
MPDLHEARSSSAPGSEDHSRELTRFRDFAACCLRIAARRVAKATEKKGNGEKRQRRKKATEKKGNGEKSSADRRRGLEKRDRLTFICISVYFAL